MSRHVHLVGIGGTGLSAIARVLLERGDQVSGSDQAISPYSEALEQAGARVVYGHRAENIAGADLVIVSSAVPDTNPEVVAARKAGLRVVRRNQFLGELTTGSQTIAVAGTHGKTTTTGLIAWLLDQAGLSPTFIAGGILKDFGTNARAGRGPHFVIEADEYDRAFLGLTPTVAVVTNVEHDHPDCYPTFDDFRAAFQDFAERVQGQLLACLDDPGAASLQPSSAQRVTYGLQPAAEWRAEEIRPNAAGGSDFLVLRGGELLGLVRTRLPGPHNVVNAVAALAAVNAVGVPFAEARRAISEFHGAGRRFEIVGEVGGVWIVDDYAHHPTEIRATLAAARERFPRASVWAVFQPHTYSRTKTLLDDFAQAFGDANHVIVTDIFASRESPDPTVSSQMLVERMSHQDVRFIPGLEVAARTLQERLQAPAVVVTLSAGDGNQVGRLLLQALSEK
ncbi:MAG: UDP-N-acetylmuramate--L-alanine ligase [Chloroflexota bacterium]